MPLGLLDLSVVTDRLIAQLKDSTADSRLWDEDLAARFTINFSGLAPDAARAEKDEGECHVSVYLFHVTADKFHRNTPPLGGSAQTNASQPFALTLYYLLTAYAKGSYIKEQQAMSIALKCFHENPIVAAVPMDNREEEFTLTIEPQTIDEIGRLWQAINAPIRLSAIYRVSVIFLESLPPRTPGVVRHAPDFRGPRAVEPLDGPPQAPTLPGALVQAKTDRAGLATIAVEGAGFVAGVTELNIRARPLAAVTGAPLPGQFQIIDAETLAVRVPLYTPQGRYLLSARTEAARPRTTEIELDVPETIVLVDVLDGLATVVIDDAGFAAGVTTARLDGPAGPALAETAAEPPAAGQFRVVDAQALRLRIPGGTASGRHPLALGRGPNNPALEIWLRVP